MNPDWSRFLFWKAEEITAEKHCHGTLPCLHDRIFRRSPIYEFSKKSWVHYLKYLALERDTERKPKTDRRLYVIAMVCVLAVWIQWLFSTECLSRQPHGIVELQEDCSTRSLKYYWTVLAILWTWCLSTIDCWIAFVRMITDFSHDESRFYHFVGAERMLQHIAPIKEKTSLSKYYRRFILCFQHSVSRQWTKRLARLKESLFYYRLKKLTG